jgi:hypothetical protein
LSGGQAPCGLHDLPRRDVPTEEEIDRGYEQRS